MVGAINLPLATVMEWGRVKAASGQADSEFGKSLADSMAPATARQDLATAAESRQFEVKATATVTRPPSDTDWIPPVPAGKPGTSVRDLEDPTGRVKDLLAGMGINPAGMQFELIDDVVNNLGGSYVNHLMRVQTGNGWKEDFAVEYILRNPSITANEIAAMTRREPAPPHLRGV